MRLAGSVLIACSFLTPFAATASKPDVASEKKVVPSAPWIMAKAAARHWTDDLLAAIKKSDRYEVADFEVKLEKAWKICEFIQRKQWEHHEKRIAAYPAKKDISRDIFELNVLYCFGNILPRVLDESTTHAPGRAYVPELAVAIEEASYRERFAKLRDAGAFPADIILEMPPRK